MITAAKMQVYVTLVAIDNQQATVQLNNQIVEVPLSAIGEIWTGDFMFIWTPPPGYSKPFSAEYSGPMVKWLAQQFAELDDQNSLLAEATFNAALVQRVKIFQKNNQLLDDGVVGLKTLLKLNERLNKATTLNPLTDNTATEG